MPSPHRPVEPGRGSGRPTRGESDAKKLKYLAALKEGKRAVDAREVAGLKDKSIAKYRRSSKTFRDQEAAIMGVRPIETQHEDYLEALEEHNGNESRARKYAGVTPKMLDRFRKDEEFSEREQEVLASLVEDIQEQVVRHARGAKSKIKDPRHSMAVLSKLRPAQWGDQPKQVEHTFRGSISVQGVDEQILELLNREPAQITK